MSNDIPDVITDKDVQMLLTKEELEQYHSEGRVMLNKSSLYKPKQTKITSSGWVEDAVEYVNVVINREREEDEARAEGWLQSALINRGEAVIGSPAPKKLGSSSGVSAVVSGMLSGGGLD